VSTAIQEPTTARRSKGGALRAWLLVAVWLAIIAVESNDVLSSGTTGGLLSLLLTPIFGPVAPEKIHLINVVLRKIGHFVGYGVLSVLLFRAWRATLPSILRRLWEMRWAILALAVTVAVAVADEWHQTRLASRTGSALDVMLDTSGALCAQAVIVLKRRKL
jgi:VanZ family protein